MSRYAAPQRRIKAEDCRAPISSSLCVSVTLSHVERVTCSRKAEVLVEISLLLGMGALSPEPRLAGLFNLSHLKEALTPTRDFLPTRL